MVPYGTKTYLSICRLGSTLTPAIPLSSLEKPMSFVGRVVLFTHGGHKISTVGQCLLSARTIAVVRSSEPWPSWSSLSHEKRLMLSYNKGQVKQVDSILHVVKKSHGVGKRVLFRPEKTHL